MIVSRENTKKVVEILKHAGKKIVFTNGCFDIIHSGHIYYLNESKKMGDVLIIGLNSDSSVRRLKGEGRPINNEKDRAEVLSAIRYVDYVVIFDEDTPENLIKEITPNVLTKGGDYKREEIVGADYVISQNCSVKVINFVDGKSSTKIIEKINSEKAK